jgi:hypothetical protein
MPRKINEKKITFRLLPIPIHYGKAINNVYFAVEGNKSTVMTSFKNLTKEDQDAVKSIISKMATVEGFTSTRVRWKLKEYGYGEIKPLPHRFFFFQKCGNNLIFFDYCLKKTRSFKDAVYKQINERYKKYEEEFEKQYGSNR